MFCYCSFGEILLLFRLDQRSGQESMSQVTSNNDMQLFLSFSAFFPRRFIGIIVKILTHGTTHRTLAAAMTMSYDIALLRKNNIIKFYG